MEGACGVKRWRGGMILEGLQSDHHTEYLVVMNPHCFMHLPAARPLPLLPPKPHS